MPNQLRINSILKAFPRNLSNFVASRRHLRRQPHILITASKLVNTICDQAYSIMSRCRTSGQRLTDVTDTVDTITYGISTGILRRWGLSAVRCSTCELSPIDIVFLECLAIFGTLPLHFRTREHLNAGDSLLKRTSANCLPQ